MPSEFEAMFGLPEGRDTTQRQMDIIGLSGILENEAKSVGKNIIVVSDKVTHGRTSFINDEMLTHAEATLKTNAKILGLSTEVCSELGPSLRLKAEAQEAIRKEYAETRRVVKIPPKSQEEIDIQDLTATFGWECPNNIEDYKALFPLISQLPVILRHNKLFTPYTESTFDDKILSTSEAFASGENDDAKKHLASLANEIMIPFIRADTEEYSGLVKRAKDSWATQVSATVSAGAGAGVGAGGR